MNMPEFFSRLNRDGIKLQLEGGELKINAPKSKLTADLLNELRERKEEIIDFLQRYVQSQEHFISIESAEEKEYYALSSAQKRLYILQQVTFDTTAYNIPVIIPLPENIHIGPLKDAFLTLIQRHESLRTSFHLVNHTPVQRIHDTVEFEIINLHAECTEEKTFRGIKGFVRYFDLTQAPLMRVGLLNTGAGRNLLIIDVHHIITDGMSQNLLTQDFMRVYKDDVLPSLSLQYKDFAEWQNGMKEKGIFGKQESYWLNEFEADIPVLNLPTDYPRPAIKNFEGNHMDFQMNPDDTRLINKYAREQGVTIYMVFLAALNVLLSKLSGQEDIVIGTPVAGRRHADLEKIIGMFVNMLAIRNYPIGELTFNQFLEELSSKTLAAFQNQEYPFEDLVEKVSTRRDPGRNPLFDVVLVVQDMTRLKKETEEPVSASRKQDPINPVSKFDLEITVWEKSQGLTVSFQYCTRLFKKETIERFMVYFYQIVMKILEMPGIKLNEIEITTEEEKKQIIDEFNRTTAGYPKDKCIHELIEAQVNRTPDHLAIIGSSMGEAEPSPQNARQITYKKLNQQSDQLANELITRGIGPDVIVGIQLERSIEMIIGILGILKAGGAYLPIDPDYPEERIRYILKDSGAKLLLTDTDIAYSEPLTSQLPTPNRLQGRPGNRCASSSLVSSLAYIIYTSGTTGKPKGVLVQHRNVVRLMINDKFRFDFDNRDIWTMFHSFNFDFSVWEMYGALLYGGKLIVVPKMVTRDPGEFLKILKRDQVTVLNQTPSAFYNLIEEELKFDKEELSLRYVIFGGEALKPVKLEKWKEKYPDTTLVNMFGITETTVHVTYKKIGDEDIRHDISNIGVPIPTMTAYIMDRHRHLLPVRVAGELLVGGDGVSRGYLNRPELTAEKFIPDFYRVNETLYRSGDLARFLPNGEMEYLGRIDHQVQLKGFRVELGEIENQLLQFEGINEAIVIAREGSEEGYQYLCAYIVLKGKADPKRIREYLTHKIPDYMIPHYVVSLEKIPLTINGKVDRSKLPDPEFNSLEEEYMAPVNRIQEELEEIWCRVLQSDRMGINTNYFYAGGDSIKAIALISAINDKFHSNLKIVDLYMNQTIESLSLILKEKTVQSEEFSNLILELEEFKKKVMKDIADADNIEAIFPMSDIEKGMIFHYMKDGESVYHDQPVYIRTYMDFDINRMRQAFGLMVEKHPILRTAYIPDEFAHIVYKNVPLEIRDYDLSGMGRPQMGAFIERIMAESRRRPFDVRIAPLWRMSFFNIGNNSIVLLWEFHHAIIDGWSNSSLLTEFNNTYLELKENPQYVPQKLKSGFKEYIIQEMAEKRNPQILEYWKNELSDYKRLNLPGSMETQKGKSEQEAALKNIKKNLGIELRQKLERLAKEHHTTLKHVCFAAYAMMLSMLSYEDDILIGLATNNRPLSEDGNKIIGCFLNTIPVRIKIPTQARWSDFILEVDKKMRELKRYDRLSLFEIVTGLGEKTNDRNPLMDMLFNFIDFYAYRQLQQEEYVEKKTKRSSLPLEPYEKTNFPLVFNVNAFNNNLSIIFGYFSTFLNDNQANKLFHYFMQALNEFITNPHGILDKSSLMSKEEKQELVDRFNDTEAGYPKNKTIHHLFEEQAERTADRIAVTGRSAIGFNESRPDDNSEPLCQMTYRELNYRSGQLASILREKGVDTDRIVAIHLHRSVEMIMAMIGILKAGGAYLPIDRNYPEERINYMLKDSGAKWFITTGNTEGKTFAWPEQEEYDLQDLMPLSCSPFVLPSGSPGPSSLAYVIYTSGTTGKPKGTLIEHRNVTRLMINDRFQFDLNANDVWTMFHSYCFDFSVWEMYGALLYGGKLIIVPVFTAKDTGQFLEILKREKVTVLNQTPAAFYNLADKEVEEIKKELNIRYVIFGGEALNPVRLKKWKERYPKTKLINMFGITETTVHVTFKEIEEEEIKDNISNIGKPIPTLSVYIIDRGFHLVPVGISGELVVGGEGVARGYLNRTESTSEKFLNFSNIHSNIDFFKTYFKKHCAQNIVYKSGDLGRHLPNGDIEYLGRIDQQVKLRGFRIELGEIENRLLNHPEIKEAIVLSCLDRKGENYLCAYIVSHQEDSPVKWRDYLSNILPDYMIPSYFIRVDKIPITSNGKVDRKALPEPELKAGQDYVGPRNPIEQKLVTIWKDVLLQPETVIGIDDDFFALGGHSLKATVMVSKIHKEFSAHVPLAVVFKHPTVRGLSEYIRGAVESTYESIQPIEEREYYELSSAQKRLYVLQQMGPGSTAYNIPLIIPIMDDVEIRELENAFKKLIRRHESLRTSFHIVNDEPVQRVHGDVEFKINDLATGDTQYLTNLIRPFDLSQAPLMRVGLKRGRGRSLLLVDLHHVITDGTSQEVLKQDFIRLFNGESLPPLRIQYKDFSQWQNTNKERSKLKQQENYWLKELGGEIPVLNIPTDYPRPAIQSHEGGRTGTVINPENTRMIMEYSQRQGVTLYMMLLAMVNILLSKITGQEDIVIGSPVAGRRHADLEQVIGMFVNTLAHRNHPLGKKGFEEFLNELKERTLDAFENQEYQFEDLVEKVIVRRDMGRNPLFDIMFNVQNIDPLTAGGRENEKGKDKITPVSKFDLEITAIKIGQKLNISFGYCSKLFKEETIQRFMIYFHQIVIRVLQEPTIKIRDIEILTKEEKNRVLYEFNNTETEYSKDPTIHELFEEQVRKTPDYIAVVFSSLHKTYRELNEQSDGLAYGLRERGVKSGTVVGIKIRRGIEMIIGIMGILKAGGAYLPIDPDYPQDRIDYIFNDSRAALVLTQEEIARSFCPAFFKKRAEGGANNLAYVIYTSGSTGRPKGVMIEHMAIHNFIEGMIHRIDFRPGKRILALTPLSFDIFGLEILLPLCVGLGIVVADEDHQRDIRLLRQLILKSGVDMLQATPTRMQMLISNEGENSWLKNLKEILVGGEALPAKLNDDLLLMSNGRIYNMYGPTETTIWSTVKKLGITEGISIGTPIVNTKIYILDKYSNAQPIGIPGELYIGGHGVARGYLNRPELTVEKFLSLSLTNGLRLDFTSKTGGAARDIIFRTGDWARWLPDGDIEFLSRIDNQVKLRGIRIELGEIENRLLSQPGINEAVALVREDPAGDHYICAYIISDREYGAPELREYLSKDLPNYMIPSFFVQLAKMPLTSGGKIDRRALPQPELDGKEGYIGPRDENEIKLVRIWKEVLGHPPDKIGIDTNFFAIGGHSLKATIMVSKIHKEFHVQVPLTEIFKRSTVRGLSEYIKKTAEEKYESICPAEEKEYYELSSAQKRLYFLQMREPGNTAYNIPVIIPLPVDVDPEKLRGAFQKLIQRHESLRTSFTMINNGPVQRVHGEVEFEFEISPSSSGFVRYFDLTKAPLMRAGWIKGEGGCRLLVDMHHIITDGISQEVLRQDFIKFYNGEALFPLPIQYKDVCFWQNNNKEKGKLKQQEAYWLKEFEGEIPLLNMPTDYPRPAIQSLKGNHIDFEIDAENTRSLIRYIHNQEVTLYMMFLAIINILLSKISGQDDIVIGTPIAGRRHAELEKIIGMFVNTLALRNYPVGEKSFVEFLIELKEKTLKAFENQEYQFEDLVEKVIVGRDMSRNPLFDVLFVLQNINRPQENLLTNKNRKVQNGASDKPAHWSQESDNINPVAKFDLTITLWEKRENLNVSFGYCTKLFKEETIQRFIKYFYQIIAIVLHNPEIKISEIDILPEEEKNRVLVEFNNTEASYPRDQTIHELFKNQVERTPDRLAVISVWYPGNGKPQGFVQMTYRELDKRATQTAALLMMKGKQGSVIGIMVTPSWEMVVGVIGALKAGCAFLPLEPESPVDRINYVLNDSNVNILLTQAHFQMTLNTEILKIDISNIWEGPDNVTGIRGVSADPVYVIYTSGTTGRPKGVLVSNRNLVNYTNWFIQTAHLGAADRAILTSSFAFDALYTQFFSSLVVGCQLHVIPRDIFLLPKRLFSYIRAHLITYIKMTPSLFNLIVNDSEFSSEVLQNLRFVMLGGEEINVNDVEKVHMLYPHLSIMNHYGPTETTIGSIAGFLDFDKFEEFKHTPTIGKPLYNTRVYILDNNFNRVPIGVTGGLFIGGDGVGMGYLNKPELTADKFITLDSHPSRIYRTGDLARWVPNGHIEFLGREDGQVKIRGYRIEPGEIETHLLTFNDVKEAIVMAREKKNREKYLCAYLVSEKKIDISGLRQFLSRRLPIAMIPSYFIQLEKIPLTKHNKLNPWALPVPEQDADSVNYVPPHREIERKLIAIWSEIIGIEIGKISIKDNFFEIGGTSLDIIRVTSRIKEDLNRDIPIVHLFQYPTVSALADFFDQDEIESDFVGDNRLEAVKRGKKNRMKRLEKTRRIS
ncbi:MAG: amino acid adenylation domain-containing protein [Candidatus Omnitrophota bacterium]